MLVYETEESYYIFFLKSGHSLLNSVFNNVFAKYSIGFNSSCNIPLTSEEFRQKQKFLFVRNPISRFFSSYYFFDFDKTMGIDAYIEYSTTTSQRDRDSHLKSQYNCLTVGRDMKWTSMRDYFDSELGEYKIVKLEDLDRDIEYFRETKSKANNTAFYSENSTLFNQEVNFNFLKSKNKAINIDFILLYSYYKTYYEKTKLHHRKVDFLSKINQRQYLEVYYLFEEEMLFYGYEHLDNTRFIKSVI